jgi:hypothetical protein
VVRRTRPRHARQNWLAFRALTAVTIASAMAALVGSFTVALQQISPGAALADTTMSSTLVTDPNAVFSEPNVAKPAYLTPITDPTYNTTLTRIAGNAGTPLSFSNGGSGTWGQDARQHYNDDQAWNADGSLLMLQNSGSPDQLILDGNTYQPKYNK